jgi:uncharacterized membrane protein
MTNDTIHESWQSGDKKMEWVQSYMPAATIYATFCRLPQIPRDNRILQKFRHFYCRNFLYDLIKFYMNKRSVIRFTPAFTASISIVLYSPFSYSISPSTIAVWTSDPLPQ